MQAALVSFRSHRTTLARLTFAVLLTVTLSGHVANAQNYVTKTLHSFGNDASHDGEFPQSILLNVNGLLYGTCNAGGKNGDGTLFHFSPNGNSEITDYSFGTGTGDGAFPGMGLINLNGTLFGTTGGGGFNNSGSGTVFAYTLSSSTKATRYDFQGNVAHSKDGVLPEFGILAVNGILYGVTESGGSSAQGTLYSVNPSTGSERIIHSFGATATDGQNPECTLLNVNGVLFGTCSKGGANGVGTIFSIKLDGTGYQTLYNFDDPNSIADPETPGSGLVNVNGLLYGTTLHGGDHGFGSIYTFNPTTKVETVVFDFGGNGDGREGNSEMVLVNGLLFGTTLAGGVNDNGIVFAFNPTTRQETIVHAFQGGSTDGGAPLAALINVNGTLYGTTQLGGPNGTGTIFSMTPVLPVANNDHGTGYRNTNFVNAAPGVLNNDSDEGNGALTAVLVTNPTHGTISFHGDGSFTYVPSTNFIGTDSFTYKDTNAVGSSNIATCSLTINARVPIAKNDSGRTAHNVTLTVNAPGVLGNDDNGGSTPVTAAIVTNPSHGTITFHSEGGFIYIPNTGFVGTDSFTYKDTNPIGTGNVATCTLNVQAVAPIAKDDSNRAKCNVTLTIAAPGVLNDDDNGGSTPMTASLVSTTSHGTLTLNSSGGYVYTPSAEFVGSDTFTYQAVNPVGKSNIATVTIVVQSTPPVAVNDTATVKAGATLFVSAPGVLGNDNDGGSVPMTATLVTGVSHGAFNLNPDGSFKYVPNTGFTGTDSFTYQAVTSLGTSNTASVTITVQ